MTFTQRCMPIFDQVIIDYHKIDDVDQPINNPYEQGTIEYYLYVKNWIDTVQWHFEDIISGISRTSSVTRKSIQRQHSCSSAASTRAIRTERT